VSDTINDGFGSVWRTCSHPLCDLHVCRPGKAQCSEWCDYVNIDGTHGRGWRSRDHVNQLLEHIAWLEQMNSQLEDQLDQQENA
jgi:hypothetical protein